MDKRTERTKSALRNALFSCMREKPVKDIPVTELCRRAGIERTSFYTHYRNISDILAELEQEQLDRFRTIMKTKDKFGEELISDVLDLIDENKRINEAASAGIFSDSFISEMAEIAKEYAYSDWQKRMPKATGKEVELSLTIMISATLQVLTKEAKDLDRETVVRYIKNMINGIASMYA